MRPKERKLAVTFETTTSAMAFESEAKKSGLTGRLIPVPKEITAGCGLCYCAPVNEKNRVLKLAEKMEYDKVYEVVI